jgi:hypothetical protein
MKKTVLLGIVALGAAAVSAYGQGYVTLDNYNSGAFLTDPVTYGANVPANGISGPLGSGPLNSAWTVGLYYVGGNTGLSEAAGSGIPNASLAVGTGIGSTVQVAGSGAFGTPGAYNSVPAFNSGSTLNTQITLEIVVWDSADSSYATAHYRGHSMAFAMPTVGATSGSPSYTGAANVSAITVVPVSVIPEPATMALGGLGLASLLLFRRKQA